MTWLWATLKGGIGFRLAGFTVQRFPQIIDKEAEWIRNQHNSLGNLTADSSWSWKVFIKPCLLVHIKLWNTSPPPVLWQLFYLMIEVSLKIALKESSRLSTCILDTLRELQKAKKPVFPCNKSMLAALFHLEHWVSLLWWFHLGWVPSKLLYHSPSQWDRRENKMENKQWVDLRQFIKAEGRNKQKFVHA